MADTTVYTEELDKNFDVHIYPSFKGGKADPHDVEVLGFGVHLFNKTKKTLHDNKTLIYPGVYRPVRQFGGALFPTADKAIEAWKALSGSEKSRA